MPGRREPGIPGGFPVPRYVAAALGQMPGPLLNPSSLTHRRHAT